MFLCVRVSRQPCGDGGGGGGGGGGGDVGGGGGCGGSGGGGGSGGLRPEQFGAGLGSIYFGFGDPNPVQNRPGRLSSECRTG